MILEGKKSIFREIIHCEKLVKEKCIHYELVYL